MKKRVWRGGCARMREKAARIKLKGHRAKVKRGRDSVQKRTNLEDDGGNIISQQRWCLPNPHLLVLLLTLLLLTLLLLLPYPNFRSVIFIVCHFFQPALWQTFSHASIPFQLTAVTYSFIPLFSILLPTVPLPPSDCICICL